MKSRCSAHMEGRSLNQKVRFFKAFSTNLRFSSRNNGSVPANVHRRWRPTLNRFNVKPCRTFLSLPCLQQDRISGEEVTPQGCQAWCRALMPLSLQGWPCATERSFGATSSLKGGSHSWLFSAWVCSSHILNDCCI